jgi:MraZ protein
MYLGLYSSHLTVKNQLGFPSKFQELTGKKLFISQWFEKSLIILPHDHAEDILNKILTDNSSLLPETRDLERFLYANAQTVELDDKNRFVIDKTHRKYAKLGKEAVFLGIKDRIELWDSEIYTNYSQIREKQIRETAIDLYNRIIGEERKNA